MKGTDQPRAWVVAVNMGYGHERAAHPLRHLSPNGKVIIANDYPGIPKVDDRVWNGGRRVYESISRLSTLPVIGKPIFALLDHYQKIDAFYPERSLSAPNSQVRQNYFAIKRGWGRDLVEYLNTEDIPLITTFFTVAFFAEEHGFKNDIYLVICDSDICRAWAPLNPAKSRIKYFVPCRRARERLMRYGVRAENIFLSGFPLPEENTGGKQLKTLKADLLARLSYLDPEHRYRDKYGETVNSFLKGARPTPRERKQLTLTFAVGGAGAQKAIGREILHSLRKRLHNSDLHLNLVAGSRNDVYAYFKKTLTELRMDKYVGESITIIYASNKLDYFNDFNRALRTTDILWTKPSELVFYAALGLPIIMAPTLGSQEVYNRSWLKTIGAGIDQEDPKHTSEWLFDLVRSGWLAEAAMSGFLDGRQFGVHNITEVVTEHLTELPDTNQLLL